MPGRLLCIAFIAVVVLPCSGQTMSFGGGAMHVQSGTQVRLAGPLEWQLAADGQVINDGTIDLGTEAMVSETDGSPITGAGTELATWAPTSALNGVEPGGLGLTITSTYDAGNLLVERGHLPAFATNGTPSIARWYRLSTPAPASDDMQVLMRYDLTELNGITAADLAIFEAPSLSGTWTPLITVGDELAQTVAATDQAPWAYLTAFDFDEAMRVTDASAMDAIRIWPTVVSDEVNIAMPASRVVDRVEVLDAAGRTLIDESPKSAEGVFRIGLSSLASGAYVLRVNGTEAVQPLIKP